ncbi:MAG: glycoside hydrolase family 99-like domain-containing protein [Clostridia bacterium]|nr:glycoside hydrolase family 99-like domain-containing protein [Clostridia bacterium]
MKKHYDVAAYIWPSYSGADPRNHIFWNEGYGEWQSVKTAEKKFEGHTWPRKPLWGYVDEADPKVMEMEINEAVSHGVNVFIYDWYWFDRRPFLEECLNKGFLGAENRNKMQFFLMWANHDATTFWDKRLSDEEEVMVWDGKVDRKEFERIARRIIERYFTQENYYKIEGCPVFELYYLQNLIKGLGGIDETADALEYFRAETKKAGFPGLHLMLTLQGGIREYTGSEPFHGIVMSEALKKIRLDSSTHYQFLAFTDMDRGYDELYDDVKKEWEAEAGAFDFPYFPHVSLGWDNNPRTHKFRPIVTKNTTPENIEKMLRLAKEHVDAYRLDPPLVTVNSWNEWTETSYLQPDDLNGYGYLDAVKRVFTED